MHSTNLYSEISKEGLCSTPSFISAKVSPDGQWIAQIGADKTGIANLVILPVDHSSEVNQISFFTTPQIIRFFWSADSKKVLLLRDEEGSHQLQLHSFDIASKEHLLYAEEFAKANVKVIALSHKENKAVIGINNRNPHFHDLYHLDLDSGKFTLLLENDTFAKFLVSEDLEVILKMKINNDGSWTIFSKEDQVFMSLTSEEAFQTEFISYNSQEKKVYFLDNRFSDTNQLTQKNIFAPYEEEILSGPIPSDIDEVLFVHDKPRAYASYYTQKKWHILDPSIKEDIDFLSEHVGSNFELVSKSQDENTWIVSNSVPDQGGSVWLYQRGSCVLTKLSPKASKSSADKKYSKMYEMVAQARDGQPLVCYYTLPKEFDQGGYVDSPIPLVVFPHGGPFKVRDKFEFNAYHQWLASCGYAVLSVNFRLSSGFGKSFVNAGNGQWGGKAHLDVIDAVEACIAKGLTEKGKLAIYGGSYGGYESLAALTFTPDYFTCCIAVCGPSNLKTVLQSVPEFWEFPAKYLSDKSMFFTKQAFITSMGGNPDDEEGAKYLEKCSPLNYLDQIKAPLLLIHGKKDHIVVESESSQIYESMKKNNQEVTYIVFPNEGHQFAHFANKVMYLDQVERFLAHHLKGKYIPSKKEVIAHSIVNIFN